MRGCHQPTGSWVVVDGVDVVPNGLFQLAGQAVDASPDLMFHQIAENRSTSLIQEPEVGVK